MLNLEKHKARASACKFKNVSQGEKNVQDDGGKSNDDAAFCRQPPLV